MRSAWLPQKSFRGGETLKLGHRGIDAQRLSVESKMRQISIILATAVITATVTVASMMAISSSSRRTGAVVRESTPIDVMKMMKDAKDLPNQSYPAH